MFQCLCPMDAARIPLTAQVSEGTEVVRFYWCRWCTLLFASVGNPGRLAAGFARDAKFGTWNVFRVIGADHDVQVAVAAVAKVGVQPPYAATS